VGCLHALSWSIGWAPTEARAEHVM